MFQLGKGKEDMKFIFINGGVISGVGKGIAVASIGRILQEYGFKVTTIKIDPYINYDAGTMRPTEHGEVFVTDDGGEIDQDLGNYERFLGMDLPKKNNITTGQIYGELIKQEREGKFLGKTVQFIPHVPNEIKRRIMDAAKGSEIALVEVGGTIGDYENMPFLFAAKSLEIELGRENICNILVSYLMTPRNLGEMKTKPTQQAIAALNESGISPDFVLCRSSEPLDSVRKEKIQTYANINSKCIISAPDIKTIYRVPLNFEKEDLGKKILQRLNLRAKKRPDWRKWSELVKRIEDHRRVLNIAMVGKYVETGDFSLADSYISINQALEHAAAHLNVDIKISWIDSKLFENGKSDTDKLKQYDGIIIPGGFGASGVEGKINAIRFARENNIPFLGLCYGMQLAVVEFARNICGLTDAHTTEVNPKTQAPVIDILPEQKKVLLNGDYGATMRLGAYAAQLKKSRVFELYEKTGRLKKDRAMIEKLKHNQDFRIGLLGTRDVILERHRHRYEVNPQFVSLLENKGMFFSGHHLRSDRTKLMEFLELPNHKFFVATQAHPEFKSRFLDPSPLFLGFVSACKQDK
jgi:CTP synthase